MIIERYRLTLTHTIMQDNEVVNVEEPKTYEIHNADINNTLVSSYKDYLLDQLFTQFRQELKEYNQ